MKAVIVRGVNNLSVADVELNKPADNDVLVKVDTVGICGSDAHILTGKNDEAKFPFIPGHEWVGHVVEIGRNVTDFRVGDRVSGDTCIPCGKCDVCRNGGIPDLCRRPRVFGFETVSPGAMAEYNVSPQVRLYHIPGNVSDELGVLVEPVAVAYHAIWGRSGGIAPHDRVVVIGAGPIGLAATGIASITGAQVIVVEPAAARITMAKELGAEVVINPHNLDPVKEILVLTNGRGATRVIECSGSTSGISLTVDIISEDGIIAMVGQSPGVRHPVEIGKTIWRHSTIVGSCGTPFFFQKTLAFLSKHLVDFEKIITHRFPLDKALEAFELCVMGTAGKILLYP